MNKASIITQLDNKNLFYSRMNLPFVLSTFAIYVSGSSLMATAGSSLALTLGLTLLAGTLMIIAVAASSNIIYENLAKKHIYENISQKGAYPTSNSNSLFNETTLSIEAMNNLCNLPKIL
ncbi:MAG: hypothetical protein QG556_440, partial [Pseudomonadota bacterium]|nr:hypothetical protein [Pseudomonadota bacterium]